MSIYEDETHGDQHIVLTKGNIKSGDPVLVRMHALDPMLDILGVGPFGRANELREAMKIVVEEGRGVVVLLRDTDMKLSSTEAASPQNAKTIWFRGTDFVFVGFIPSHFAYQFSKAKNCRVRGLWAGNYRYKKISE